jgi:DNA-binding CsgD family transcriptional regulator
MMFNVKVFADFEAPAAASGKDRQMLDMLVSVRKSTGANFVNLSAFDYRKDNPDTVHFVTYPMDWIAQYVRSFYSGIDPFHQVDFRRASHLDWRDLYSEEPAAAMFRDFSEAGLGNNALSMPVRSRSETWCALSLIFRTRDREWEDLKRKSMELFRFEADRAAEKYTQLYESTVPQTSRLTAREIQVLRLVAFGKTDEQIAAAMRIGKWTVVSHLQSIKFKLGSPNRASAVAFAITNGLIDLRIVGEEVSRGKTQSPKSR